MPEENNDPINSLPEYEVRTMQDDINKLEGRPTDKKPIRLNLPPLSPTQSSNLEKPKIQEIPKESKLSVPLQPIDISPPETLPIIDEKPVIKKAPLPGIEDFIVPAPKPEAPKPEIPITPKAPIIIEAPRPKIYKSQPTAGHPQGEKRKMVLPILIVVLIIIALGAFLYWQGTKPEPTPTPTPTDTEINIPESLIRVDETKVLKTGNNIYLDDLLRNESMLDQQPGTVKRIVAVNSPTGEEKDILPLNELLKQLKIVVYPYILSELSNNYNLIIYSQGTDKIIGLVIKTNNPSSVKSQLKSWESTMTDDLKNLFLFKKPGNPTTKFFKDNKYNNVDIRYINFPGPDLTIDCAVSGDLLLISTSRESMYNIIDRLK